MELRIYTLARAEALRRYTTSFWPGHIQSLRRHGITVHGVWIDVNDVDGHRVIALVGYPPGSDPAQLAESYRRSPDFVADHAAFDVSLITSTQTKTLEPIPCSPLQ
ncbi:MAG: hypothetical protein JWR11_4268 [Mycobacterium sp.]|jgi:hypothetical protein|nr:hypothetical protein [Mycobacterium sp.]